MIYIATLHTRSKSEPCFEAGETRRFGTRAALQAWADTILPPIQTTRDCYWRDVGRAPHVSVLATNATGKKRSKFDVQPEVHIVPSCGELGYF
jgi:hypothetical protein